MSGPPCTLRSAWSSPARLTPAARTRPATGLFQIDVGAAPLPRFTNRGRPTLTLSTCPSAMTAVGNRLLEGRPVGPAHRGRQEAGGEVDPLADRVRAPLRGVIGALAGGECIARGAQGLPQRRPARGEIAAAAEPRLERA